MNIKMHFAGKYCIYRKKYHCPAGLISGDVFWDDEDTWNTNRYAGTLPDGTYNSNTWIYFCCKTDGDKDNPILLPSRSPFFLLACESAKCQMVKWAVASLEWIYFDTEDWNNQDQADGAYPHDAGKAPPTIYYCYYRGEKNISLSLNNVWSHFLSIVSITSIYIVYGTQFKAAVYR